MVPSAELEVGKVKRSICGENRRLDTIVFSPLKSHDLRLVMRGILGRYLIIVAMEYNKPNDLL
jgi:hypothetical protein